MEFFSNKPNMVVAAPNEGGEFDFLNKGEPFPLNMPGVFEGFRYWMSEDVPVLFDNYGVPGNKGNCTSFPTPGGVGALIGCFPPHSAGKLGISDLVKELGQEEADFDSSINGEEDDMHASDSLDFQYILSGKIDFVLPGGKVRTLTSGDMIVVVGAPHAWRNHYDEPCTYLAVCVGAVPPKEKEELK